MKPPRMLFTVLAILICWGHSLSPSFPPLTSHSHSAEPKVNHSQTLNHHRRIIIQNAIFSVILGNLCLAQAVPLDDGTALIRKARAQLTAVPDLIQQEKWDSVRAVLITPPLSDCWSKTNRPLLQNFAEALGEVGKDELAALEAKEEANSHLRYLDMAVYNNVFNPIKTEGETGATKGLIKSYYEDPFNEYKASLAALDELLKLATE